MPSPDQRLTPPTSLAIDIGLASGSGKTIDSIKLYHNDKLLREVGKTIRAGESHPEEFSQPLL